MGDYDAVVADCDAAVEKGRELRADYKMVARALTRKGSALVKKGDLPSAIATFNKALTEHRCTPLLSLTESAPLLSLARATRWSRRATSPPP